MKTRQQLARATLIAQSKRTKCPIRKVTRKWRPKDAAPVRICDMGTAHIENCIAFLERKFEIQKASMPYPDFDGEMAQYYAENAYERFMEAHVEDEFPIVLDFHQELRRRQWLEEHE
jgi:hypothetical protein